MCISRDKNHFQDVIYLLSSIIHCPNGVRSFYLLSSHKVLIAFLHVLHSGVVVFCFLGRFNSCIRLKFVTVSIADCWRWVPWWLLISLMNKIPLDIWYQFMASISEVVKSPSNARYVMRQTSCMHCVDISGPRWEMFILLVNMNLHIDMNFHTSSIQESVRSHGWVSV